MRRREVHEIAVDFFNQSEQRLFQFPFVHIFAGVEPVAAIVTRQTAQKLYGLRRKIGRHTLILKRAVGNRSTGGFPSTHFVVVMQKTEIAYQAARSIL